MPRPRLSSIDLWADHEERCLSVLRAALTLLSQQETGPTEDEINRDLYGCLAEATSRASHEEAILPPIAYECRNPPASSDEERAARESKRPDFQWGLTDHLAKDPRSSFRHFVIECKRLAPNANRRWVYTEQYVINGIRRFVSLEHGYGNGTGSGAMVGYVQSLSIDEALAEVNAHAVDQGIPALSLSARDGEKEADLEHSLGRPFDESPYRLLHLWVRVGDRAQ